MLTELHLENFKCFESHRMPFKDTTIIVGPNNAGKSTVVEALRLLSMVANRYQALNYHYPPAWTDAPKVDRGVSPSLQGMRFTFDNAFYCMSDPPAKIRATFSNKNSITIYIGPDDEVFAVIAKANGEAVATKGQARKVELPKVGILPQLGPLLREEVLLDQGYVRRLISSDLASLHFRNQLRLLYHDYFTEFKRLAEDTWPGLLIDELLHGKENKLSLFVRDGPFEGRLTWMGHGLQMWLQTAWFLTRVKDYPIVILDEPDVYMHADMQRRLIRLIKGRHKQIVVATHSIEIMAEVHPSEILVVDKAEDKSAFAGSLPAVQRVIQKIGGVHNIHLTRMLKSRQFVFVEGKDIRLLKHFQNLFFPNTKKPLDVIPNASTGGWGGWVRVVECGKEMKNLERQKIITYCVLDRDFHTPEEIKERLNEAKRIGVELHIWSRKEIENYLLVPSAIRRVISRQIEVGAIAPDSKSIEERIRSIAVELKNKVTDSIVNEIYKQNKKGGVTPANRQARRIVNEAWGSWDGLISILPGKTVISRLSKWSQSKFDVSFGVDTIARELRQNEIAEEVTSILNAIEKGERFS